MLAYPSWGQARAGWEREWRGQEGVEPAAWSLVAGLRGSADSPQKEVQAL